ncbi:hypothetical protein ACFLUP_04180 [Chloroflexota bacterium]
MHPLDGPRLKIRRAEEQIKRLSLMEDSFKENTKYNIIGSELNLKSGNYVYRMRVNGPPLPVGAWGIYIGEIAYNLRSALDQLVYQLALLNTPAVTVAMNKSLQFPIFRRRINADTRIPTFERGRKRMIGLLSPKHQTDIERLQPYKRKSLVPFEAIKGTGKRRCNNPLFWLEEINNADKHRLIQVVSIRPGIGIVIDNSGISHDGTFSKIRVIELKDGAKFGEAPAGMKVNASIFPNISFKSGCKVVRNMPVTYVFNSIIEYVPKIIDIFSHEF